MKRVDIINYLANKYELNNYLEIGVHEGITLNGCSCSSKIGVDPNCSIYKGKCNIVCEESDNFFSSLSEDEKYDIVFIDGFHEEEQVFRDITNSLEHLSSTGFIVVHDCNPPSEYYTRSYEEYLKNTKADWNGTVYKGYIKAAMHHKLKYVTVDTDWGVGIIQNIIDNDLIPIDMPISWSDFSNNRKDMLHLITIEEFKKKFSGIKIYGFYHVACMNNWKPVFDDQIIKISSIPNTNKIFVSVIYEDDNDIKYVRDRLTSKFEIVKTSSNFKDYEFGILKYMQDLSQEETFYCFYLHTKGVSITEKNMNNYPSKNGLGFLLECIASWREYMEYFLVNDTKNIIEKLNSNDAVGVSFKNYPTNHFSGNFWWSKSDYIKQLAKIEGNYVNKRYNAEFWIGNANKGKLFSLCKVQSSYNRIIGKNEYIGNNK